MSKCYAVNEILMKKQLFLRIYKSRNKFRFLINKLTTGKNEVITNLLPCVIQKYNGYQVVKIEKKNKQKQLFEPIDIVYEPVQNATENTECYFTFHIHVTYRLQH